MPRPYCMRLLSGGRRGRLWHRGGHVWRCRRRRPRWNWPPTVCRAAALEALHAVGKASAACRGRRCVKHGGRVLANAWRLRSGVDGPLPLEALGAVSKAAAAARRRHHDRRRVASGVGGRAGAVYGGLAREAWGAAQSTSPRRRECGRLVSAGRRHLARQLLLRGKDAAALAATDDRLQLDDALDVRRRRHRVVIARARHARRGRAVERRLAREAIGAAGKGGRESAGRSGAGHALRRRGVTLAQRAALLLGGRRVGRWRRQARCGVVDATVAREAAGGGAAPRVLLL
eukprot:scaffold77054_cov62-Phaeocystis_antarctica.AAC.2